MNFKLKIDAQIFEKYPTYQALVIYAANLTNGESDSFSSRVLREAEIFARSSLSGSNLTDHPHIAAWRDAFRQFGTKPKKYQCGAETLLRRVLAGNSINPINRLVDIYNSVSIRYGIPIGGENRDNLKSDLVLKESDGTEPFEMISFGTPEITYPDAGEIIWADSAGCTVRRWNWRQTRRTAIDTDSHNCYFVLDRLTPLKSDVLQAAGAELINLLQKVSPESKTHSALLTGSDT